MARKAPDMGKTKVSDFDPEVCEGCPFREQEGGEGLINSLADLENSLIGGATGEQQYKCGLCGCPLKNLEVTNLAPDECPRLSEHNVGGRWRAEQ